MLADYDPVPTLAVSDLARAREYYEGVLGFTPGEEAGDAVSYTAGSGAFLVYISAFAGTNKATAMSLQVPRAAFETELATLRGNGVVFQTFELEGITWTDDVAIFGDDEFRAVWFEDPDGNILNLETTTT